MANTADFVVRAVELQQARGLSIWDALIVEASIESRCEILLSEDLQEGARFGALTVVNPFLEPPAANERVANATRKTRRSGRR